MKYVDHLLELTKHFIEGIEEETSVASLADILNCSERHVKTVVNVLHSEGAIKWITQKGRGKKPKITIQLSSDEILLNQTKELVRAGRYQDAFSLVESMDKQGKKNFQQWFPQNLGLAQQPVNNRDLDILRYPFYETRLVMDPMKIISRHDGHMVQQLFDRLVEYDTATNELKPSIAHHWETKDGKHWTFYLHKGITFHHGRECISSDVQSTFERLMTETKLFANIEKIDSKRRTIVHFMLKEVDFLFPRMLAGVKASIVPMEIVRENPEKFASNPVGSGPFRLMQNDENIIRLEVNHSYFSARPWLDEIHIIKTPSNYEEETIHPFVLQAPDSTWKPVKRMEDGATFVMFNCLKEGVLQQEALREAIYTRLQSGNIRNEGLDNEVAAVSFLSSRSQNVRLNKIGGKVHYEGLPLKIAAQQIRPGANHEKAAKHLHNELCKMGIDSTLDVVDIHQIVNDESMATYDLFVGGIALGKDRLLSLLTALQSNELIIYQCLNEQMKSYVDEKIKRIRSAQVESIRWEMYFEIEAFLKSNYAIFFCNHRFHTVYETKENPYANIELDSNGRVDYRKVWRK
ncbi:SgrR family transcriptional regulator [Sporosarcina sp. Sa2YVA2]|uniref:SgrR family transcriptional regulator n=1 Tax=Sporosarcina quadrami TaxID=2762234 RepID=A0ABR8UA11_9BACL|nr:ABC transporter substrate-binding protein [Sporosarcina quadrami]MBD7984878.1 SgrR family transcriptional regulator [Sporosarcina quadrami]